MPRRKYSHYNSDSLAPPSEKSHFEGHTAFLGSRKSQRSIDWSVDGFEVQLSPLNNYEHLSVSEQAELFNKILVKVRSRSEHPDGFFSAALAITNDGKIFVASNTERQHTYHKDCAETNLVTIITQLHGLGGKINKLYLTAGFDSDKDDVPFAPCGKCLDALNESCIPECLITMFPVNDGIRPLKINRNANSHGEVKSGETWETRVSKLLVDTFIPVSDEVKENMLSGLNNLFKAKPVIPLSIDNAERILAAKQSDLSGDEQKLQKIMKTAAINKAVHRISEPELDVDHSPSGINRFMIKQITQAYLQRSPSLPEGHHAAETVRCVVIRLTDGSYHSSTEVAGPEDNSVPHAEILAACNAQHLGKKIAEVWAIDMNEEDIRQGIMRTSSKEPLERLYKRRSSSDSHTKDNMGNNIAGSIKLHYIPFNNGSLTDREVPDNEKTFQIEDLHVGRFQGALLHKKNGNGNARQGMH